MINFAILCAVTLILLFFLITLLYVLEEDSDTDNDKTLRTIQLITLPILIYLIK